MKRITPLLILCSIFQLSSLYLPGQATFIKHAISTPGHPSDVFIFDINSDGYPDLVTVSATAGEVAWWQNDGDCKFTGKVVRTGFAGCRSVRAGDLDNDGDIDLVAASWSGNAIECYINGGSVDFTTKILDGAFSGAHTVQLVDLDQDNDLDILCSGWDNSAALSQMAWWENEQNMVFAKHVISGTLDQSPFIDASDLDGDGDLDLVGTDETSGEVFWWRNGGNQDFTEILIDDHFSLAHTAVIRDLDKDGDPDILGAACTSGLQAWYENKGAGVFEKHPLENLAGAIWLDMGDFDLDGDMDMIGAGMGATQLALYTNSGRQQFSKTWIAGSLASGFALNVADMDNDQDPDIVAIGYNSNFLGWWENTTNRTALLNSPGWICPGTKDGSYFVVNSISGNVIRTNGLEPNHGLVNATFCQAIALVNGMLYATVGAGINGYHPESGIRLAVHRCDVQYLEGLTADPSGILYATAPLDGKIIRVDPSNDDQTVLISGLAYPRAIRYDPSGGHLLFLDGEETVIVRSIDPASGDLLQSLSTTIQSGGDLAPDEVGNVYLSSPSENAIYSITGFLSGGDALLFMPDLASPWGISFESATRELVVVMNSSSQLVRIPATVTGTGSQICPEERLLRAYPNPFHDNLTVSYPGNAATPFLIQLIDQHGRLVDSKWLNAEGASYSSGGSIANWSPLNLVPPGIYFLKCTYDGKTTVIPLIHQ